MSEGRKNTTRVAKEQPKERMLWILRADQVKAVRPPLGALPRYPPAGVGTRNHHQVKRRGEPPPQGFEAVKPGRRRLWLKDGRRAGGRNRCTPWSSTPVPPCRGRNPCTAGAIWRDPREGRVPRSSQPHRELGGSAPPAGSTRRSSYAPHRVGSADIVTPPLRGLHPPYALVSIRAPYG